MLSQFTQTMAQQIDKAVLFTMNRRLPDSFVASYDRAPTFEAVLRETAVDTDKTVTYTLTAPGIHPVWLHSAAGPIRCQVRVRPAADPHAPLLIYHHGFNEYPYDNSWRRLFPVAMPFPAHAVCVQAPFHSNWTDPFNKGFESVQSLYQIFSGSLRIMAEVQQQFEKQGAAFTVLAGVSWGGITSLLYEGLFHRTRAVIPMLSSPNLAQVMWDIAELFARPLPISKERLAELLDFTPYCSQCQLERIFPLLGESDQFFQLDKHASVYDEDQMETITASHITGMWQAAAMRQHIERVLQWAQTHPLEPAVL